MLIMNITTAYCGRQQSELTTSTVHELRSTTRPNDKHVIRPADRNPFIMCEPCMLYIYFKLVLCGRERHFNYKPVLLHSWSNSGWQVLV